MAPPPKPPIICYDLQTNTNARRIPCARYRVPATRAKVTIVPRDNYEYCESPRPLQSRQSSNNARHAYGQKLRRDAEEREKRVESRRRHLAMQAQLEEISAQLEASKRIQENLLKTFGMSHNTAKYIQLQDENYAKLRQKVDQFAETRSKELGRRVQQMKRVQEYQQHEDKKAEERRLRDMSKLMTHNKHTLSSTLNNSLSSNSPITNTATSNTENSSSTISISSCSSSLSTDELMPSVHFVESPQTKSRTSSQNTMPTSSRLLSSSGTRKSHRNSLSASKILSSPQMDKFSFYKGNSDNEILEITDMAFMEKIEDKSMLEVNELMKQLQSALEESRYDLQQHEESQVSFR